MASRGAWGSGRGTAALPAGWARGPGAAASPGAWASGHGTVDSQVSLLAILAIRKPCLHTNNSVCSSIRHLISRRHSFLRTHSHVIVEGGGSTHSTHVIYLLNQVAWGSAPGIVALLEGWGSGPGIVALLAAWARGPGTVDSQVRIVLPTL